jgi:hypothetical protein
MKTSSFRTYTGPGRISIARWAPRNCPPGYRVFRPLAPGDWAKAGGRWVDDATFLAGYDDQLSRLDPRDTWDRLHQLAGSSEPVLLCWEVPPFDPPGDGRNWCHRRLVAAWFEERLGVSVPELPR